MSEPAWQWSHPRQGRARRRNRFCLLHARGNHGAPAPQWSLEKTSNPVSGSSVKAGEKVTYTLKVTNTSDEADLHGAVAVDDLSDVLKHATLTGDTGRSG